MNCESEKHVLDTCRESVQEAGTQIVKINRLPPSLLLPWNGKIESQKEEQSEKKIALDKSH